MSPADRNRSLRDHDLKALNSLPKEKEDALVNSWMDADWNPESIGRLARATSNAIAMDDSSDDESSYIRSPLVSLERRKRRTKSRGKVIDGVFQRMDSNLSDYAS